jgi:hypothetical protein
VQTIVIDARQPAVLIERVDLEIDRAVAPVGVSVALERDDHLAHRAEVASSVARGVCSGVSRPSTAASSLNAAIHCSVYSRSGRPAFLRAADRLVVDVGVVDDAVHLIAADVLQRAGAGTSRQMNVRKLPMWPRA